MEPFVQQLPIMGPDRAAASRACERWNSIAKPVGSLGVLEDDIIRIAALTGSERIDLSRRCVVVFCADNGVVAQGVSQSGSDVTLLVARNVAQGVSSINAMCSVARADCIVVDMGMFERLPHKGIRDCRLGSGTADISRGPAMSRAQALEALRVGVSLVGELAEQGYGVIATGEIGIGNTTTSTAMACAFVGKDPVELTGPGAGLSAEGVRHKAEVIRRALAVNQPDAHDPLDVLAKLGGFDIAAMCGVFLSGAVHRVPIVIDGLISTVAAYCAYQLRSECREAFLASHLSTEPAAGMLLERMELSPPIHAGMHLGEGTGAVCLLPLLDMAANLYATGTTFADCGITSYKVDNA